MVYGKILLSKPAESLEKIICGTLGRYLDCLYIKFEGGRLCFSTFSILAVRQDRLALKTRWNISEVR